MILYTERLLLEPSDHSKDEQVLDYVLRNRDFLREWDPVRTADYYTLEAQRDLVAGDLQQMAAGQLAKFWIYKREEPARIIGSIALSNIVRGVFLSCHLGYRLDHEEVSKGFMTEALAGVIQYAFDELKLHRIEANIMPRNAASFKVVEKLRFADEGLARKYLKINGEWEDHVHMVLLNDKVE
ncbi:GNAT family N-acetyltransferase [Paenibacillus sp. NPDC058071]|uniref:GNAT family N-acetyltransferase n=1 Tax=Paenibacillus sp. NPDC058071 TaxID=3346326 RepID=UPI0036D9A9F2